MEIFACLIWLVTSTVGLILTVGGTAFWIWMLVECATKESTEGNTQMIWVVIIALTHFIGGLLYFLIRRPDRIRELGQ